MQTKESTTTSPTGKIIQIDESRVRDHLAEIVRGSVEETLNAMLQKEAGELCQARRYERKAERVSTRAGTYERKLETKAGEVTLRMPKLRAVPFETAIVERYRRRESSVEEALIEMHLAGVSVVTVRRTTLRRAVDLDRAGDQAFSSRAMRWRMLARWSSTTLAHLAFQP